MITLGLSLVLLKHHNKHVALFSNNSKSQFGSEKKKENRAAPLGYYLFYQITLLLHSGFMYIFRNCPTNICISIEILGHTKMVSDKTLIEMKITLNT